MSLENNNQSYNDLHIPNKVTTPTIQLISVFERYAQGSISRNVHDHQNRFFVTR